MERPGKALVTTVLALLSLCRSAAGQDAPDWREAVRKASELSRSHRYVQAVSLLEPLARQELPDEARFEVEAELGRALFHVGRYPDAWDHLVEAARIQPRRVEVALYLEAVAWVTGRRKEALAIFDGILASGARDLYLAVTLPGERSFLGDPEVRAILERHRKPLEIDLEHGVFSGARLGDPRSTVAGALGMTAPGTGSDVLTARAGPMILWALRFDGEDRLAGVVVHVDHVERYTPYALTTTRGLHPGATAAEAMVALGAPAATTPVSEGTMILRWDFPGTIVALEFGVPEGTPSGGPDQPHATLRMIEMSRP